MVQTQRAPEVVLIFPLVLADAAATRLAQVGTLCHLGIALLAHPERDCGRDFAAMVPEITHGRITLRLARCSPPPTERDAAHAIPVIWPLLTYGWLLMESAPPGDPLWTPDGVYELARDCGFWLRQLDECPCPEAVAHLTQSERDILSLVAHGASTKAIADRRVVEPATVKSQLKHLYRKLGVHSREAATLIWNAAQSLLGKHPPPSLSTPSDQSGIRLPDIPLALGTDFPRKPGISPP